MSMEIFTCVNQTLLFIFQLCAYSAAQLHRLIQTKLISSSAEASFLIGHLNDVIVKAVIGKK